MSLCERGDQLLAEEIGKVYKGKKILKGQRDFPTDYLTNMIFRHCYTSHNLPEFIHHAVYSLGL